jgi:hypothetical protein
MESAVGAVEQIEIEQITFGVGLALGTHYIELIKLSSK